MQAASADAKRSLDGEERGVNDRRPSAIPRKRPFVVGD
jgi:hypothetical protein